MKTISLFLLTLLTSGLFVFSMNVHLVSGAVTIYIRADGSIDPLSTPISTSDNVTYTFTEDINGSIVVERNNIILNGNGHTLHGQNANSGFNLNRVYNTTIKNLNVRNFRYGFSLNSSFGNTISDNNITKNLWSGISLLNASGNHLVGNNIIQNNEYAIDLDESFDNEIYGNFIKTNGSGMWRFGIRFSFSFCNKICGNTISENDNDGIWLLYSNNNTISRNTVTHNHDGLNLDYSLNNIISENTISGNQVYGVILHHSSYNRISRNTIYENSFDGIGASSSPNNQIYENAITENEKDGILITGSANNTIVRNNIVANQRFGIYVINALDNCIYHNNFLGNTQQVWDSSWDNTYSYPSVNKWDDGYPSGGNYWSNYNGTDLDSDGLGDTPFIIDENNTDRYPLVVPCGRFVWDINGDLYVGVDDIVIVAEHFGSYPIHTRWNPTCDINSDYYVGIDDAVSVAQHFGESA